MQGITAYLKPFPSQISSFFFLHHHNPPLQTQLLAITYKDVLHWWWHIQMVVTCSFLFHSDLDNEFNSSLSSGIILLTVREGSCRSQMNSMNLTDLETSKGMTSLPHLVTSYLHHNSVHPLNDQLLLKTFTTSTLSKNFQTSSIIDLAISFIKTSRPILITPS